MIQSKEHIKEHKEGKKRIDCMYNIYIYIRNVANNIIVYLYIVCIYNNDAMVILQNKTHNRRV